MFELPNPTAHNFEGKELDEAERNKINDAIEDGSAIELTK
jgi:hypothetical protein